MKHTLKSLNSHTPLDNLLAAMSGRPLPAPPEPKPSQAPTTDPPSFPNWSSGNGMPQPVVVVRRDAMGRPWARLADTKGNTCQK